MAKVERSPGGCWEWTGAVREDGYARFYIGRVDGRKTIDYAHRVAYRLFVGPIPDGLTIDHLCRNRSCVNPDHLEAVTQRENVLRGEALSARRARQTHCAAGHPLSGDNLYRWGGRRYCRACRAG